MTNLQIILLALLIVASICIFVLVRKFPRKDYKAKELYVKEMPGSCADCALYARRFKGGCKLFHTFWPSPPNETGRRKDCPLLPMNKAGAQGNDAEESGQLAIFKEAMASLLEEATGRSRSDPEFRKVMQAYLQRAAHELRGGR